MPPKKKAAAKPNVSAEELLGHYREMLLIRRFEEKAGQLYGMGLIGGFCHLYIGQEAVVVGLEAAAGMLCWLNQAEHTLAWTRSGSLCASLYMNLLKL